MGSWISGIISKNIGAKLLQDRDEYRKVFILFGYLFSVVSASTIGRTTADTLFLSRFDNSALSYMYLPQALIMIAAGLVFQRFSHRLRIESLITGLIPLAAVLVLISRVGVGLELRWVFPVIYIGYDVINFLMIVCFWQFATAVMDQRKAKRMIGIVGSGGITGGILSGFGLKALAPVVGTANLIYFYVALHLLGLVAVLLLRGKAAASSPEARPAQRKPDSPKGAERVQSGLFANVPYLKAIAVLSVAIVMSLTLIDYQFKVILRQSLQNEALAGFMGSFYGFSGLVALFIQLFIAGRVLTRFGVMISLLVFPVVLAAGSLGILLLPVLAMAVVVKGSDKAVGDTLYSSVNQLVMFPVPPEWRGKAKSFLDGVVRNGAKGLAAVCLLVVSQLLAPEQLSWIVLLLLAVGIFYGFKVKKAYLQALMSSLQTGEGELQRAELNFMDPSSRQLLIDALSSADKQQTLYAIRILRGMESFDLAPHLKALLHHPVPEVRIEALAYVRDTLPAGMQTHLQACVAAASGEVRAQAILALAAYAEDACLDEITDCLEDESVTIQAAAIAGLIKYYGIEGMFRAVGRLKELIDSDQEKERTAMARLFGEIGIKSFYKPLLPLLSDKSSRVRNRALESAAILRVPALIPSLVANLKHSHTRRYAIDALAAYDEGEMENQLKSYWEKDEVCLHIPAIFERMGTQQAFDILFASYEPAADEMRDRIVQSLLRMHNGALQADSKEVERLIAGEIDLYGQYTEHGAGICGEERNAEIEGMLGEVRTGICRRIFQLLSFLYDGPTMQAVFANWSEGDARRQANAEEVIDQTLRGKLRLQITQWMSSSGTIAKTHVDAARLKYNMSWLASHGDAWFRDTVRFYSLQGQESALKGSAAEEYGRLSDMAERVRLLRKVSIFQGLSSRDLFVIAGRLQRMSVAEGGIIIQEGEPGDSLMIVDRGRAGVYRNGQHISGLNRGSFFGEMAILTRGPRTATILAEENVKLWRLDASDFYDMMFDQSSIMLEMMKLLSRRLRAASVSAGDGTQDQGGRKVQSGIGAGESQADGTEGMDGVDGKGSDPVGEWADVVEQTADEALLRRVLVLQKIDLFAHLAPADFVWLAQNVEEVSYEQGGVICSTGDIGDAMYGIIEGVVRVHRGNDELAMLHEGDFFGEMAIIDSGPRSADCTAASPTVLLKLHKDQVFAFCFRNIDVMRSMMRVLADRLKDAA
ncbi:cyclic nucleotide-binding domain-containing protein [Paenibacillus oenotherae]|uniref:ADP,ATP carrier protein n=1 Tax=Paenibacillus oenotherae TaxID=1435645 RepID=A0ABS7D7E8_9BACL|nr:Npt1/Npt2 family nucleotide transporter [Paenibacillus oenotherae]MBW7475864.1 cyclic nucleotide-binding domain-containing protein [Paenibacillus oenotherae]